MAHRKIERTMRRMLHNKERLNRRDAVQLKEEMLAEGYLNRSEQKVILKAIQNDLFDEYASDIIEDVLIRDQGEDGKQPAA